MNILKDFIFSTDRGFASWRIPPIVLFKNKVPYNIFQNWFKDTRKKVVEVWIDGASVINDEEKCKTSDQPQSVSQSRNDNPVCIWIDIRVSNGLHL